MASINVRKKRAKRGTGAVFEQIQTENTGKKEIWKPDDIAIPRIARFIEVHPYDKEAYDDMITLFKKHIMDGEKGYHLLNRDFRYEITRRMEELVRNGQYRETEAFDGLYRKSLLLDAPVDFDSFLLYLELNRDPDERFYPPRRKVLRPIVNAYQEVQDGKLDLLTVSQPKRTGKSTLGTWFVLFRAGQHPNGSSFCCGSGDTLVKSFYNGMAEILKNKEKYLFHEIFPDASLVGTNADEKTLNLNSVTRFATITCRSIDGAITGSTEATPDGVLYLDDMVANEEEAINNDRLEFLWNKITGDLLGRRLEGCPIVAQGTRYSLYDPLGHLQEEAPRMGWRTKVLEIPALDPVTDESNFEITLKGRKMFTTAFYRRERELVTDLQWQSQFQQQPFEKRGRLYDGEMLRRYFELPAGEPDAIIAVCDTKDRGEDYAFMPVAYRYGEDYFIVDLVCDNRAPALVREKLAEMLVKHKVQMCRFESNSAGGVTAEIVSQRVKELGGSCGITTMYTTANKETKILVNSPWVMEHCVFRDKSHYDTASEYGMAMRFLTAYTLTGKKQHDDVPDGLAMLALFAKSLITKKVEAFRRPW